MSGAKDTSKFKKTLRKSGYKATSSRLAILEIFNNSKQPLSAQGVTDLILHKHNVDQATVYRTLKSFKTKGILRQIDLRHNHAHYELADLAEHHHLICLRCGKIEDARHCGVEAMQKTILQNSKHFAEIKQHALEFYGICKACEKKE